MQERTRRIFMTIVGVLICGFSVGMFNFSTLGLDPFQVFTHGIFLALPEGKPGFGTVVTAFFMGPLIAFFNRTVAEPMRYGKRTEVTNEKLML